MKIKMHIDCSSFSSDSRLWKCKTYYQEYITCFELQWDIMLCSALNHSFVLNHIKYYFYTSDIHFYVFFNEKNESNVCIFIKYNFDLVEAKNWVKFFFCFLLELGFDLKNNVLKFRVNSGFSVSIMGSKGLFFRVRGQYNWLWEFA